MIYLCLPVSEPGSLISRLDTPEVAFTVPFTLTLMQVFGRGAASYLTNPFGSSAEKFAGFPRSRATEIFGSGKRLRHLRGPRKSPASPPWQLLITLAF